MINLRPDPRSTPICLTVLAVLALLLHLTTAGQGELFNETDGQYGAAAKTMVRSGDWLVPENNGEPRLVKPPLLYWMISGSFAAFGVNEFAARLPIAIGWVVLAWAVFLLGRDLGGAAAGFRGGLVLLTSLGAFTLGRIIMPEVWFAAFIALALRAGWNRQPLGFWFFCAAACLVKGPHGLLWPVLILGLTSLLQPGRELKKVLTSLGGWLIFAGLVLPWYLYLELRFPGVLSRLLVDEALGHALGTDAPATSYSNVPRWQFLLLHLAWLAPWSLAILAGIREWRLPLRSPWGLISAWALVIGVSVLLIGQRQDYYALPVWGAFALGVGIWWGTTRSLAVGSLMLAGLSLIAFLSLVLLGGDLGNGTVGSMEERATAWSTLTQLGAGTWNELIGLSRWVTAAGFLCGLLAWWLARTNRRHLVFAAWTAFGAVLGLGANAGMRVVTPLFTHASHAEFILDRWGPSHPPVVFEGGIDTGSSLMFYLDQPIVFDGHPGGDYLPGGGAFLVLIETTRLELWQQSHPTARVIFQSGTQLLVLIDPFPERE